MKRKGIILAGGEGTRLNPLTLVCSKQLLPVFNKPMIFYPLSVLMLAKIRDVLIIIKKEDKQNFYRLLGNGSSIGMNIKYSIQNNPNGIAEALLISEKFLNGSPSVLILGDNIFFGNGFINLLDKANQDKKNSTIFLSHIENPERYGVVSFKKDGSVSKIYEKPKTFHSNYAVTGLYFYNSNASKYATKLLPSKRGELEITDLNNIFIKKNEMNVLKLKRGFFWSDVGTHDSLLETSSLIKKIEERNGLKIGCIEEIALKLNFISKSTYLKVISKYKGKYRKYLNNILK